VQARVCDTGNQTHTQELSLFLKNTSHAQALPPLGNCVFGLWNRAVAPSQSLRGEQQREGLLAIVEVSGDPVTDMSLPTAPEMTALRATVNLPVTDISSKATGVEQVVYKLGQDPQGTKNYFQVNYASFDPANVRRLQLNKTEQWNITTIGDPSNFNGIPLVPHVFHIHVNPFQYTRTDPTGKSELVYKDTLFIPAGNGKNSLNVYTTYTDFTGQFVMHCHILDHEDLGMMEVDEVVKDIVTPMKMESVQMLQQHMH
jgi:FtsP/CotA-like multicopper oxidase with cupredoxin domain